MSKSSLGTYMELGRETTWGTPVAPSKAMEIDEESMAWKGGKKAKGSLRSVSQRRAVAKKIDVGGGVKLPYRFQGSELLLKDGLGACASTQQASSIAYSHAFTLATALPVGLSVGIQRGEFAKTERFAGCKIQKLGFSQGIEDELMLSVDFVGKDSDATVDPTSPTFSASQVADWENMTVLTLGGSAFAGKLAEFSIENVLYLDSYKLTSKLRQALIRGGLRKITGKIDTEVDAYTYLALLKANNTLALQAKWVGPLIVDTYYYSLQIDMPAVLLDTSDLTAKGAEPLMNSLAFTAYVSAADNDELSITAVNTATSVA